MTTTATPAIDSIWTAESHASTLPTRAAVSLARVWQGYILCASLDNPKKSNDVWVAIFDSYTPQRWSNAARVHLTSVRHGHKVVETYLQSVMPPVAAYWNLNAVLITSNSQSSGSCTALAYPSDAESPDDFAQVHPVRTVPMTLDRCDLSVRPALVNLNNRLVFLYRRTDGELVCSTAAADQLSWTAPIATGLAQVVDGPSLTVFGGKLVCAFTHADGRIMTSTSADGTSWSSPQPLSAGSSCGPAISADPTGRTLVLMYVNSDKELFTIEGNNGQPWISTGLGVGKAQGAPALLSSAAGSMLVAFRSPKEDSVSYSATKEGSYSVVPAFYPPVATVSKSDRLTAFQNLTPGQQITSPDGRHRFIFQTDGNVVLYNHKNTPTWASGTFGRPNLTELVMQNDGNLVLYDNRQQPFWNTVTEGHPGAYVVVENNGNVVVYDAAKKAIWSTNTAGG